MSAVTINVEVEKLTIKSPEFIQLENHKNRVDAEIVSLRREMDDLGSMRDDLEGIKEQVGK